MLWNPRVSFQYAPYKNEAELEKAIQQVKVPLFGPARIYLDVKRQIGGRSKKNIPDGYLIDLTSKKQPALYIVEVELERHELLRHIAVQILEFSLAFEDRPQRVKSVVRQALAEDPTARQMCETYASANGFENVDFLLERMVYDGEFAALVIIDELEVDLEAILVEKFKFGVEVIELACYRDRNGEILYQFHPFLADVEEWDANGRAVIDSSELDTIVVPARPEGFTEVFLGENRWWEIRIHGSMIPKIKYIASYRTAPESAITHVAPVKSIKLWRDGPKYVVNFAEPAAKIGPLRLLKKGRVSAPQGPRYTSFERLKTAKTLDDVF